MVREKTRLELLETIGGGEADRLRESLFIIHGLDDIAEIKRVAQSAMAGEKHGLEIERQQPVGHHPHFLKTLSASPHQ